MEPKVIVITGASDGIGAAGAAALHEQGDTVVIVGRSAAKTKAVADELGAASYVADFTELDDVRRLADELRRDLPRIDVLANNAGGIFGEREVTVDGHEKTMQVNHLAPFLLTNLLIDVLVEHRATVINTSSAAHSLFSKLDLEDIEVTKGYSPQVAYGNAKLENILFTKELHRRFHDQGISTAAFHPGGVATNFASESKGVMRFAYHTPLSRLVFISPAKGADTLVWLASSAPDRDWTSGEYYYKRKIKKPTEKATDAALAQQLWERSTALCDL